MNDYQIYYVGTDDEVAHHAAPLQREIDVRICDPQDVVRFARPNDLAIFYSEHFHRFREAWFHLSRNAVNTLYAIDGILEWRNAWENRDDEPACPWTMRPVLSDKVACIGDSQARILNQWGNAGKTEVVGIPRLDNFSKSVGQGRKRRRDRNEFTVLVTTAKWPGFTPEQVQQVIRSLQDLKQYFEAHATLGDVPLKVHWRLTGDLHEVVEVDNQLSDITGAELATVLQQVDAVITTPSTLMLEAMLCDLPVAVLDYTNSPRYVDAAWNINAECQIDAVMRSLVCPSSKKRLLQSGLLSDSLQLSEPAASRLITLAVEMIRIGHDHRAANQPVRFPKAILAPLSDPELPPVSTCFAGREVVCNDSQEVLAVAAESLRRVNHLNQRIDLLERELERAAEGFQRIASHPVLAPLVKVRKIAMNMGGQIARVLKAGRDQESESESQVRDKVGT